MRLHNGGNVFFRGVKRLGKNKVQEISHSSRHRDYSDRRDHVYGLLSLDKSREVPGFHPSHAIDETELLVRLCVTILSTWPRDWMLSALRGSKPGQPTLLVAKLYRCLLHGRVILHKAIGLVADTYKEQSESQSRWQTLAILAADFQSHEWCLHELSNNVKHGLFHIQNE